MIKPDYISFSQETFNDCEKLRMRLLADISFKNTSEFFSEAVRLGNVILGDEYGRYLVEEVQNKK